jgi:hypothetical protein
VLVLVHWHLPIEADVEERSQYYRTRFLTLVEPLLALAASQVQDYLEGLTHPDQ